MNSAVRVLQRVVLSQRSSASATDGGSNIGSFLGFEAWRAGYGLTEKPIKSLKLTELNKNKAMLRQEATTCRERGKGFQSWKALYGHMRCHPKRDRISNSLNYDSWTDGKNEEAALLPGKSKRMRYYKTATTASSSVSEIDQEQSEGALCLMMLSKDVGRWGRFNSVQTESADSDPVILEAQTRSSGLGKLSPEKEHEIFDFCCEGDDKNLKSLKIKKPRLKNLAYAVSDFGFLRVGLKKIESKVSVDGILRDDQLKKTNLEDVAVGKDFLTDKKRSRLNYSEDELGKDSVEEAGMDQADSGFGKYNGSGKKSRSNACYTELGGDSEICKDTLSRSRFECRTCNKIFHSHQALGGHRSSHKKIKACIESSENSIDTDVSADQTGDSKLNSNGTLIEEEQDRDIDGVSEMSYTSKKSKGHECPICFKVFGSGQALGGHKRAHLVGGSEHIDNQAIVIQQQLPEISDLFDLNLPPIEEEINGDMDFNTISCGSETTQSMMSWRV